MTSIRLRESVPTTLYTQLTKEADQKGVRTSQLLTQILMERYKFKLENATLDDLDFEE